MTPSVISSGPVAVVLAAGLGMRLQAVQADRPKGFVEIGGGTLIARSVQALRAAGVREFVFVTGWKGETYREWCVRALPGARCVTNADFATTGSLRSFALGAATVPGRELLIVESDLLYERRAPEILLGAPERDVVLASGLTRSGDEVWIHANAAGNLERMSKQPTPGRQVFGELVGLTRVSPALAATLVRAAEELPAAAHYEDGLNAAAPTHPIALLKVPDLAWCEIDDPGHLARAQSVIWPRIVAADARQAVPT